MLAFALSFDDLVVTSFNAGVGSTTLPIFIYSAIKFGVSPQINAISTIIVAVVAIALFIAWRLGRVPGRGAAVRRGGCRRSLTPPGRSLRRGTRLGSSFHMEAVVPYRPLMPLRNRSPGPFFTKDQLAETEQRQQQDRDRAAAEAPIRERDAARPHSSLRSRIRRALGR